MWKKSLIEIHKWEDFIFSKAKLMIKRKKKDKTEKINFEN